MSQIGTQAASQLNLSSLEPLSRVVSGAKPGPGKLAHAAVEFESVLLGQWLGSAEKSFATVPGSEDSEDSEGEQMMGFAMQQLAHSIASKGGIGIARLVGKGLEHAAAAAHETAAPLSPNTPSALPAKLSSAP